MKTKTEPPRGKPTAPWMRGLGIHWQTRPYVFGDGLWTSTEHHSYQIVPGVRECRWGAVWAMIVDDTRNGWPRFESMERAQAEAELLIMVEPELQGAASAAPSGRAR